MRILIVSKFLHHVGGVETYVRWLARALVDDGHDVALLGMQPPASESLMDFPEGASLYLTPNRSFEPGAPNRTASALSSVYSPSAGHAFAAAVNEFKPDVAHFHGTCYQLTPSVFHAATKARVPAVLTAHEYKLVCANQRLFDDRRSTICTACLGRSSLGKSAAIVRRSCIKGSVGASVLGALETPVAARMWRRTKGRVLAPSRFARDLIAAEWGGDNVHLLELPWPAQRAPSRDVHRDGVLYMGRLTPEKGIFTALEAWALAAPQLPDIRLRIAGRGDAEAAAKELIASRAIPRVDLLGYLDTTDLARELDRAIVTIHPAAWFENSPFSVRESLCAGVPAIVSNVGGMPELVPAGTGQLVPSMNINATAIAIATSVSARMSGTIALTEAVRERRVGCEQHLGELSHHYRRVQLRG